jgi:protein phosphatase
MRLRHYGHSDVGLHREHNEDAFLADPELGLFVVADGVGGRAKGEVASQETVELIWDWVKRDAEFVRRVAEQPSPELIGQATRLLRGAIQNACYLVHSMGEIDPERRGMSTTASAFLVAGSVGVIGQVGDSRVYLCRNGAFSQLTEDHTLVNYQLKMGIITPAEAERSSHKNVITRAVGHKDYVEVDTVPIPLFAGDRLLLCSDGLHGYVNDPAADLQFALRGDLQTAVLEAIRYANECGGKDNITALLVELSD